MSQVLTARWAHCQRQVAFLNTILSNEPLFMPTGVNWRKFVGWIFGYLNTGQSLCVCQFSRDVCGQHRTAVEDVKLNINFCVISMLSQRYFLVRKWPSNSSVVEAFCSQTSTREGIYSMIPTSSAFFGGGASGILLTSVDKKPPLHY